MSTYSVMEFYGNGDQFFGGQADDRSLKSGAFMRVSRGDRFATRELAQSASDAASKREGGKISILEWRDGE